MRVHSLHYCTLLCAGLWVKQYKRIENISQGAHVIKQLILCTTLAQRTEMNNKENFAIDDSARKQNNVSKAIIAQGQSQGAN